MSLVERALKKIQESKTAAGSSVSVGHVASEQVGQVSGGSARGAERRSESSASAPVAAVEVAPRRIVHIDRDALRAARVLPPAKEERFQTKEYRHIKRPLIDNALGRGAAPIHNGHLIMMASALPGDGKTFTSVNLALSMALEKDISILLVDADVAKPHISDLLDLRAEKGLLDVLRDESLNVESVILPTSVPRLSVLPAGQHAETATELLASARMEEVLARIIAHDPNRIVLLDSPPLLLTSESRILAGIAGQIVLVVRAGGTPQAAVLDTLALLGDSKSIGLVLNQADERSVGYYDYYGDYDAKGS